MSNCYRTHKTGRVEFLLAGLADHFGQRVVGAVDDTEADHTVLHSREVLVQVALP